MTPCLHHQPDLEPRSAEALGGADASGVRLFGQPCDIFQREWELKELLRLYEERQPKRVLEIGSYWGGTLWCWLTRAKPGTVVVAVDSFTTQNDEAATHWAEWCPEGVRLEVVRGVSQEEAVCTQVRGLLPEGADWVFIDADHLYEAVKQDWLLYGGMCRPGGLVVFHDILTHPDWPAIQVERLWREIQRAGYVTRELVADSNAKWGGLGIAYIP